MWAFEVTGSALVLSGLIVSHDLAAPVVTLFLGLMGCRLQFLFRTLPARGMHCTVKAPTRQIKSNKAEPNHPTKSPQMPRLARG